MSFSQYYVPGSVGKQVTIECKTNTLTPNIDKMAVYKTLNGTNETIASYSSGNTNSISDVSVTFQSGVLTLKFLSLKCSDEGLYICVVTSGSSEVSSPLSLTLQPTGQYIYIVISVNNLIYLVFIAFTLSLTHFIWAR